MNKSTRLSETVCSCDHSLRTSRQRVYEMMTQLLAMDRGENNQAPPPLLPLPGRTIDICFACLGGTAGWSRPACCPRRCGPWFDVSADLCRPSIAGRWIPVGGPSPLDVPFARILRASSEHRANPCHVRGFKFQNSKFKIATQNERE